MKRNDEWTKFQWPKFKLGLSPFEVFMYLTLFVNALSFVIHLIVGSPWVFVSFSCFWVALALLWDHQRGKS